MSRSSILATAQIGRYHRHSAGARSRNGQPIRRYRDSDRAGSLAEFPCRPERRPGGNRWRCWNSFGDLLRLDLQAVGHRAGRRWVGRQTCGRASGPSQTVSWSNCRRSNLRRGNRTGSGPPAKGTSAALHSPTSSPQTTRAAERRTMNDFVIALTADFFDASGAPKYRDIGLSVLSQSPRLKHGVFKEHQKEIGPEQIAGAALDCFADEPITKPHRFGELENVILAPHCIAWTDELFRDIGRAACQVMVDLSQGSRP